MALQNPCIVPLRIDAILSDGKLGLAPPMEDFTALSNTVSTTGNFSNAMPWLGESVDIPTNEALPLPSGLHLHWTLPPGLRNGTSVYVITYGVLNELVRQGVPCSLVQALKDAAPLNQEYTRDGLLALVNGLAPSGDFTPLTAADFAAGTSTSYSGLVSSDTDITVVTIAPDLGWDPIFLQIYAPIILQAATQMKLPPVPNRWLVLRMDASNTVVGWVVESDRLTAPNSDGSAPAGAGPRGIPAQFSKQTIDNWSDISLAETFAFLGSTAAAMNWAEDATASRLSPLTAVGPGNVEFAAFYPNCQGVFGFYDPSVDASSKYEYCVIGWFSSPADDPLSASYAVTPWVTGTQPQDRAQSLGWVLQGGDWSTQDGSIYVATIDVAANTCAAVAERVIPAADVMAAIGNTAGEALSVVIAGSTSDGAVGLAAQSILNAAQAGVLSNVLDADGPAVIENALHNQAFQPEAGGWSWQVAFIPPATPGLSGTSQNTALQLSQTICDALLSLNAAQTAFDVAWEAQQEQRHLLFTDWCRVLHLETDASGAGVSPPFPNGATNSNGGVQISNVAAVALTQTAAAVGQASTGSQTMAAMQTYLAAEALYLAYAAAAAALATEPQASVLYLRRQPGLRYWRANDPVVMLTEQGGSNLTVNPPDWLPYQTIDDEQYLVLSSVTASGSAPAYLPAGWDSIPGVPAATVVSATFDNAPSTVAGQSWRPLSLQWQASYFAYPGTGSITPQSSTSGPFTVNDFDATFITENFVPDTTGIELTAKSGVTPDMNNGAIYRGRATLSSHGLQTMQQRILQLTGQLNDPPPNASGLKLPGVLGDATVKALIDSAYDSTIATMSQVLNGFHDELLMLRRISQVSKFSTNYKIAAWQSGSSTPLPAWDEVSQSFYDEIGTQGRTSPDQDSVYNPIRAGQCQLNNLVLVDAFGQRRQWLAAAQSTNMVIANTLPNETPPQAAAAPTFLLPPRYAQAARLIFRWLAADGSGLAESGQDPITTPVCGWVALNRVDETIMVFLQDGTLVGWIVTETGTMTFMPGKSESDITDPFQQQVMQQITANPTVAQQFYDDVDEALLTIEPRSHRQHVSRSVLVSRPLALARVCLGVQLKGVPMPHQGYAALATMTMTGNVLATEPAPSPYIQRETCAFEQVQLPVRLGDVSMDDDGLAAYWTISGTTISAQYVLVSSDPEAQSDDQPYITVAPASAVVEALLLIDPRAKVHATTGVLPVKDITIPNQLFAQALSNMEYLMEAAPVLTPSDQVAMPLPAETNSTWSWLVIQGSQWSDPVTPSKTDAVVHAASTPAVLRTGYLKMNKAGS